MRSTNSSDETCSGRVTDMTEKKFKPLLWTRREAIFKAGAMLGGTALVGQSLMLAGCEREEPASEEPPADQPAGLFSEADVEKLAEIAETILPETATPGAKAAGVGPFIALMVADTYSPDEQRVFRDGLAAIDEVSQQAHGSDFLDLSAEQRLQIAERLDQEQYDSARGGRDGPPHYFRMLKELTVLGLFTSEVAYRDVLEWVETPTRYDGNRDLTPEVRMFAGHGSSPFNT